MPESLLESLARRLFWGDHTPQARARLVAARRVAARLAGARLAAERMTGSLRRTGGARRPRVLAVACWDFPIYSQTFVYEELTQLQRAGFDVRLLYAAPPSGKDQLGGRYEALWRASRRTYLQPERAEEDMAWFRRRAPGRVEAVLDELSRASGMDRDALDRHEHVRMAFSFARIARAYRPDYVHSYFFYEGTLFAYVTSQLLDVPRGVSCYADHMLQDFSLKVVPLHLDSCDVVVATSCRIEAELLAMHPSPDRENVFVKPNAIDATHFPVAARTLPPEGAPFGLVCISRLEPKKGLLEIVEAVGLLREQGVDARLRIVGDADPATPGSMAYAAGLRDRIAERDLAGSVTLEGRRSQADVLRFLHDAQVFVAPFTELAGGDKDGIPTVLLEAMATGIPVVATDAGSMREVVEHGINGLVVPQRDARALAGALADLLADPALRERLGRTAALTARERFDVLSSDHLLHERVCQVVADRRRRVVR